jgi:hypothetical protein
MKNLISIIFLLLYILPAAGYSAEESDIKTITIDTQDFKGRLKAGGMLGYPMGITAGYRFSNEFEVNGVLGSNYRDVTAGINGLFTLFNIKINNEIFPVSAGPALYSHFDHHDRHNSHGNDDGYTKVDILGIARLEYDFRKIPLNLFVEAGPGLEVVKFADIAGSFAIGARYIF